MLQVWRALAHFNDIQRHLYALNVATIEPPEMGLA
jgi:hypothetical protein